MIDQAAVMRKTWARSDVTPLSVHRSGHSQRPATLENRCGKVATDFAVLLCALVHTVVQNGFRGWFMGLCGRPINNCSVQRFSSTKGV